jgi:hypothetical protein
MVFFLDAIMYSLVNILEELAASIFRQTASESLRTIYTTTQGHIAEENNRVRIDRESARWKGRFVACTCKYYAGRQQKGFSGSRL